jgi:3-hydroxybutyryl-CoA dehydratase
MPSPPPPLWFEDFRSGDRYEGGARTLAPEDISAFADLSGDRNPLHLDDGAAHAAGFPRRIAHGVLGLALATGLLNQLGLTRGTLIALAGVSWEFRRPILVGDLLRLAVRVGKLRPSRAGDRGIVHLEVALLGGDGEPAQEGELKLLVRRRPSP